MSHNKELDAANKSFWRSAAITAASVAVFTVSAIALDMGVTVAETAVLEIVAAVSAVGSVGGAAYAQRSSNKIDRIELEMEAGRVKEIDRTTEREIASKEQQVPQKAVEKPNLKKHIEAVTKVQGPQAGRNI